MDHGRRWHCTAARLALVACLLVAVVPATGVVICFSCSDASIMDIGLGSDCPCGLEHPADHPACTDVAMDGLRDRVPSTDPLPGLSPVDWIELTRDVAPIGTAPVTDTPLRPPATSGDPPASRRALAARRAVVLLI